MFHRSIGSEIINISLSLRKHKDCTDDIPNCPSIENIIDMAVVPNEIPPSEKTETSNVVTDSSSISNAKLPNGTVQSQTTNSNSFPSEFANQGPASERRDVIQISKIFANLIKAK
uniref:Uncharacterized protein n=1 Tax=Wuchereria bancrofti TaxID=6293 RepID=A0AAF5Q3B9_WUCBA